MSLLEVTRASAESLPAIMPVMTSAFDKQFGEAWTEAQCLGVLAMPGSQMFVADNGQVIGFALSRTIIDECELMLLAVAPGARRTGVGRHLLAAIIDDARASGATSVFLEVRNGNPAIALYSSAGFVETGRRRGYYRGADGETFDALTYRLVMS